jgi:hypothetical protein
MIGPCESRFENLRINSFFHGLIRLLCFFRNNFYTCRPPKPSNCSPSPSGFPTKTLYAPHQFYSQLLLRSMQHSNQKT